MRIFARRLVTLLAIIASAIVVASFLWRPQDCESGGRSLRGEVKRNADGRLLYFDGRCWTPTPMAPRDTPY